MTQNHKLWLVIGAVAVHWLAGLWRLEIQANRIKVIGREFYRQQSDWT